MNISDKDKRILIYFGIFLIGFVYFYFGFSKQISKYNALKTERTSLEEKYASLEKQAREYNLKKNSHEEIRANYINLSSKMPPNLDEKFAIVDLLNFSQKYGVKLMDIALPKKEKPGDIKLDKVSTLGIGVNLPLTYNQIKAILDGYDAFPTLYSVSSLSINPSEGGKYNTSFNLNFYSFDDKMAPLRLWQDAGLPLGKSNIFAASGEAAGVETINIEDKKDFMILLNTVNAPTGNITMEKSGNSTRLFGKNKSLENVDINIEGKENKYSYSMSTEASTYPKSGTETFKPNTDSVIIYIVSQPRKYQDDKNIVSINIHNKSDLKVQAIVTNEDPNLPRAMIIRDGDGITVQRK